MREHQLLMASTGLSFAAFFAGKYPAITPTIKLIPTPNTKLYKDKNTGKSNKALKIKESKKTSTMPINPPIKHRKMDSSKKSKSI